MSNRGPLLHDGGETDESSKGEVEWANVSEADRWAAIGTRGETALGNAGFAGILPL